MQETSELYKRLLSGYHTTETKVTIGGTEYTESILQSVDTKHTAFGETIPTLGCCVRREIDISMLKPDSKIDGLAQIHVYVRLTDGKDVSEWIPQGVFYADEIEEDAEEDGVKWLRIHGYDVILFAEQDYPSETSLGWPARDVNVAKEIAAAIGTTVDPRTISIMTDRNMIQYPTEYSCREVLGYIAAMYAGCFVTNETGQLRLITLGQEDTEDSDYYYLADTYGYAITFGGDMILV